MSATPLTAIAQSTLGAWDTCPRRLQYDLEVPVYHRSATRAVGTAYHAAMEYFYGPETNPDGLAPHRMASFMFDVASTIMGQQAEMAPSHRSEYDKTPGSFAYDETFPDLNKCLEVLWGMIVSWSDHSATDHLDWRSLGFAVLAVEQGFKIPLFGDVHRVGSIDLVLEDSSGWITAVDFKTAGKPWPKDKHNPRKQNQPPWYLAALKGLYPDRPGYRFFYEIMTYKGVMERRLCAVTDTHIRAVDEKAVQVYTAYNGMRSAGMDLPANPSSTLCNPKWCDHWTICPHGAALDS
jgi:hypothetical protein